MDDKFKMLKDFLEEEKTCIILTCPYESERALGAIGYLTAIQKTLQEIEKIENK